MPDARQRQLLRKQHRPANVSVFARAAALKLCHSLPTYNQQYESFRRAKFPGQWDKKMQSDYMQVNFLAEFFGTFVQHSECVFDSFSGGPLH